MCLTSMSSVIYLMSKSFLLGLQDIVYKKTYVILICQFLFNTSLRRHVVSTIIRSLFKYIFVGICSSSFQRSGLNMDGWKIHVSSITQIGLHWYLL